MTSPAHPLPPLPLELDRSSGRPLHQQLFEHYRQLIEGGKFPVGSRLPTEMALTDAHRVSRGTVRQAMRSLSDAGLIHRETKNGTVVSAPPPSARVQAERIIGVVFPETHDAFCLDIMKGVQAACRERGYHAAFGYSRHSSVLERAEVMRMKQAGFGGVLVLPHDDPALFSELSAASYPFVYIDQRVGAVPADFVGIDNVGSSLGATDHLLRLGYRAVAFVHQNADLSQAPSTVRDRYRGYRAALTAYGVPFQPSWLIAAEHDTHYAEFLLQAELPRAVVAANDHTALKLLDAAFKLGLSVPEELAVVGFDDIPQAVGMALTTVVQPSAEIGLRAAQLLIDRLEGAASPTQQLILPTQLVVRQSCGAQLV